MRIQPTLLHPQLSYKLTGILFTVHNEIGRYGREIQYGNLLEIKLKEEKIDYLREFTVGNHGNIIDFLIDNKIVIELKAKQHILREDYYQIQRYLHEADVKLGLLVNFRSKYLRPLRIIRINKPAL